MFSSSQSSISHGPIPARIIDPRAMPYYWLHQCLNETMVYTLLEEGIATANVPIQSAASSSTSSSFSSPSSTPSPSSTQLQFSGNANKTLPQCARCGYVPRHNTILTNESYQPVETLAGRNLLADRFVQFLVRCGFCHQTTKNYLPAHAMYNRHDCSSAWPGDEQCNTCWHYHVNSSTSPLASNSNMPSPAKICRDCTIVNPFGEDFMMLLGHGAIAGGPLHRHLVATRMEIEIQSMQAHRNQEIHTQGGSYISGAATVDRKRKAESAGLQQGIREGGLKIPQT